MTMPPAPPAGGGEADVRGVIDTLKYVVPALMSAILIIIVFSVVITVTNAFGVMVVSKINNTAGVTITSTYNFLGQLATYFNSIGSMIGALVLIIIAVVIIFVLIQVVKGITAGTRELTGGW